MKTFPRYADAVKRYVRSRLATQVDRADDVVQDVFLAAWENLGAYLGDASLKTWLMGIARNKVSDYYRARLREPEALEVVEENPNAEIALPGFDEYLDKEIVRKKTWEVLGKLPERYRMLLIWRYWDECSVKRIALQIGKSEKATERMLARARDEFRWAWNQRVGNSEPPGIQASKPALTILS
jgi:RNA polymerase sigma-70 factor (ECF subfamily)